MALSITQIYLEPGTFRCNDFWSGVGSPSGLVCLGKLVVPGTAMRGWVAFDGTDKIAAVALTRLPPHGSTLYGSWHASIATFVVPPAGWAVP